MTGFPLDIPSVMHGEILKLKRTAAWRLTLGGAVLLPVLYFAAYLHDYPSTTIFRGNPWSLLFGREWQALALFLLPAYIVLMTALVVQVETRTSGWKGLLSLPVSKASLYFSKLLVIICMFAGCFLLFLFFNLSAGLMLAAIHPDLGFSHVAPPWEPILARTGKTFLASLGLLALQYGLSLRWKHFVVPAGIGMAGLLLGMLMIHHWKYQDFLPYAEPALSLLSRETGWQMQRIEWISLGYFLLFGLLAFLDFVRIRDL